MGKLMEVFCLDYDKFCCSICFVIKYRYCECVEIIEDVMKEMLEIICDWNIGVLNKIVKVIEELIE